jgi:hypothetical protein
MPSPKSPSKALAEALAADPIYQAMLKGNANWGNIVAENEKKPKFFAVNKTRNNKPHKAHAIINRNNTMRIGNVNSNRKGNVTADVKEILDGFKVPDLKLRKGIWENFPVALVLLDDRNGVDRYGVAWHNKNLREWKDTKSKSAKEKANYQHWCEVRLLHSVRQYPKQYKILPGRNPSQLFVLEMVFKKK